MLRRLLNWWNSNSHEQPAPAHERWPEILHWQEGDEFDTRNWSYYRIRFLKFADNQTGAYCKVNHNHVDRLAIESLVGHNISLRDRKMTEQMKNSGEYNELIRQFNIAYRELEERDKRNGVTL